MYRLVDINKSKRLLKVLSTKDYTIDTVSFDSVLYGKYSKVHIVGLEKSRTNCTIDKTYKGSLISYSNTRTISDVSKVYFTFKYGDGLHIYFGTDLHARLVYSDNINTGQKYSLRVSKVHRIDNKAIYQVIARCTGRVVTYIMVTNILSGETKPLHVSEGMKTIYMYDNVIEVMQKTKDGSIIPLEKIYL